MNTDLLKELGLDKAANNVLKGKLLKRKMSIAYENYRVISPEIFERFDLQLKEKTYKKESTGQYTYTEKWQKLIFIKLSEYGQVPPPDCLMDLKKAKDFGCFDNFEVAKTIEVENYVDNTPRPDPIIFGLIDGCVDKFFITQWDDDVSIEDILNENEG